MNNMLSKEQLEKIANPVAADIGGTQSPIVTEMAIGLLSLSEQLEAERQRADALQTERDEFRRRLKLERSILEDTEKQLAELKALPAIPKELFEIGELIRTQDNRITDQPFFAVMVKREIISSEDHDYDRICWVENQSGDYCEATDTQHRRLEAIYQGKYEVRDGWDRYAMKEIDVFVTGCFTEQGCKDYICRNRHNMNKPFVYAFGSYRNNEYQVVRNFLQSLTAAKPAED
ncbi:Uncharacterised protein [Yersinia enterocolitica]|nr:Uncharacterised protein [Yersinia enterocolitica]